MKLRFGSFLANYSMSDENPKPIMVDFGFENTLLKVASSTGLFWRDTRSIRKAFLAPEIWNKLGFVLWIWVSCGLHSESTPMSSSSNRISSYGSDSDMYTLFCLLNEDTMARPETDVVFDGAPQQSCVGEFCSRPHRTHPVSQVLEKCTLTKKKID